jgi:hypothetical protein
MFFPDFLEILSDVVIVPQVILERGLRRKLLRASLLRTLKTFAFVEL